MKSERVPLRGGVGVEVVGVAGHDHPCVALVSPADFPTGTEEVDLSGPSLQTDDGLAICLGCWICAKEQERVEGR